MSPVKPIFFVEPFSVISKTTAAAPNKCPAGIKVKVTPPLILKGLLK